MKFFDDNITNDIFYKFHNDIRNHVLYKHHVFANEFMDTEMLMDYIVLKLFEFKESASRCDNWKEESGGCNKYTELYSNDRFLNNLLTIENFMQPFHYYYKYIINKCKYCWFEIPHIHDSFMNLSSLLARLCDRLRGCMCLLSYYPKYTIDGTPVKYDRSMYD